MSRHGGAAGQEAAVVRWREYATVMVDALAGAGALADPAWRAAMLATPRHVFLPGVPVEAAYTDEAIVTQTRPAAVLGGEKLDLPTSSASAPTAVAVMLDRLDVVDGQRVLEIGTGTGYNTALLCHRLGDRHVYSLDLDPDLVTAARTALAGLGYHPTLVA
ncbi:MAG TPA: methyltransferase domain-containing protein, partial [Pseudonocardiaceae bacterium]|nr:methyltransferase domain-containing protein [Pseudonocardiaceae bacterium]